MIISKLKYLFNDTDHTDALQFTKYPQDLFLAAFLSVIFFIISDYFHFIPNSTTQFVDLTTGDFCRGSVPSLASLAFNCP